MGQLAGGGRGILVQCGLILILILLGSFKAFAQTSGVQSRAPLWLQSSFYSVFQQKLNFNYESYTSAQKPAYSQDFYSQNLLVNWSLKNHGAWKGWKHHEDGSFTFSAGDEWLYPKIKDFYIEHDKIKIGVVNHKWSDFEEEWRLGLYRPRFMENKLSGGQGGLAGIYFQSRGFSLGFLPINIPELGPHYKEENGELVSRNPWFGGKPTELEYNGTRAPIRYSVHMPPLQKLVLKPGVVAGFETPEWGGFYRSKWSAAYKPMPQVLLNFPADGRLILGSETQYFSAEIQPWVAYHTLFSTDQRFSLGKNSFFRLSVAREIPTVSQRPDTWVTQELGPATYLASRVEFDLGAPQLFFSQLKVWGGDRPDKGRYAGNETFFERRQIFREAYAVGFETDWFLKKRIQSSFSVIYDVAQEGGVFTTRHELFVNDDLAISAHVELLGLTSKRDPLPDGFLSVYRANDRAELGVSYVF